ncbi:hypothetical protein HW555_000539 [Spodoptera exigua]|uniref:Regulatory protein zeste n=1 Tax=Spodoptera exigua TaxID=7107 RepID=A0A835GRS1_SPOEX|nr:hypothetical protein HW555_000539 [Spodoptera exigua]
MKIGNKDEPGQAFTKNKKPMTREEVLYFVELIQNRPILTSRETNAASNKLKDEAWTSLVAAFNVKFGGYPKQKEQLKLKWDNLKKAARKRTQKIPKKRKSNILTTEKREGNKNKAKKIKAEDGRRERNLAIAEYLRKKTEKLELEIKLLKLAYREKLEAISIFYLSGLEVEINLNCAVGNNHLNGANHIDYEKWNNHQRGESNNPVFRVMGQFLGYPNLIARTHEFFEKSLIYYNGRPDLMCAADGTLYNKDPNKPVCWNGQKGGLEGLRQKGWSITNLLVIRREGRVENTRISILAQGDNQVICTQYKLQKVRTDEELDRCIQKVLRNNQRIMGNITQGTEILGLIINQSETIRSADYLNYGKVPIFRGKTMGLESKRWSRVTCVSNDQLPTIGNIMSTVSSNALSVGYFSESPTNAISHYNFIGNLALELSYHNPATKSALNKRLSPSEAKFYTSVHYRILLLYLDPSLGGICGVSLTRFLIRSFPDPLTEGLSFWKGIFPFVGRGLQSLINKIGNPQLCPYSRSHFPKLLENPLAINLRHGVNPVQVIKEEIKKSLITAKIQNHIVRHAVMHSRDEEQPLYAFLESITPRFLRFLSEYKAGTYLGMTEGLVGLFQNPKTVRNIFSSQMKKEIDNIIIVSEIQGSSKKNMYK